MPLPILSNPVESDLVRLFHRMTLHFTQHLGETEQLDAGTAIVNPSLANVYDANVLLDAALPDGVTPQQAVTDVNQFFLTQGSGCRTWVMNPSSPKEKTEPLAAYLVDHGAAIVANDILYLRGRPAIAIREQPGLTIIPARASFKHARQIAEIASAEQWDEPQLVEAQLAHLDDPHWDALLALRDGQPVAMAGVLAVGDAGLIEDVYVVPSMRRLGIGLTMMSRVLEICARSLFKHVMLSVLPHNQPAQMMYGRLGFQKVGTFTAYCPGGAPQKKN
jgi:ribosomal protein S18 acetylase RimI-like enzyme